MKIILVFFVSDLMGSRGIIKELSIALDLFFMETFLS